MNPMIPICIRRFKIPIFLFLMCTNFGVSYSNTIPINEPSIPRRVGIIDASQHSKQVYDFDDAQPTTDQCQISPYFASFFPIMLRCLNKLIDYNDPVQTLWQTCQPFFHTIINLLIMFCCYDPSAFRHVVWICRSLLTTACMPP